MKAIEVVGLEKSYAHFGLGPIDLAFEPGQVLGLVGPNGAGKSTLMRILLGLVLPDGGSVQVLGYQIPRQQALAKREIGFASEDLRLYGAATLRWHMDFVRGIYPSWNPSYAERLLRRFDLRPEQKIKGLSHGQRVKASLLLALGHQPRMVILDEPTTGLDPVARHELLSAVMEVLLEEERTVLFSSHNTRDVEQIADRIAFLEGGRLLDYDDKEVFLERWRRLRLEVTTDTPLARLPNQVSTGGSSRQPWVITDRYGPEMAEAYRQSGATLIAAESLSLEEIFLTRVAATREGARA